MEPRETDVGIIGAGPSGSVMGGILAERGHRVTLFESDTFPRFHVGESLLPMTVPHLEEFGVDLSSSDFAKKKSGALFYDPEREETAHFPFSFSQEGTYPHAYQVFRDQFDLELSRLAEKKGARLQFNTEVTGWKENGDGVFISTGKGNQYRAKYLVDASGQQAIMGRHNKSLYRLDDFGKVATFTHFHNINCDVLHSVMEGGEVLIGLLDDAWSWCIPLPGDVASVGVVEKHPNTDLGPAETIRRACRELPMVTEIIEDEEEPTTYNRCAGYSFINRVPYTRRTVALGDAYVFIDPIYSTAIHRALYSANLLADELDNALENNEELELSEYFEHINRANDVYVRMVYKFYHTNWVEHMFFGTGQPERVVREITSMLAGDVWRDDNQFMNLLLDSTSAVFPDTRV